MISHAVETIPGGPSTDSFNIILHTKETILRTNVWPFQKPSLRPSKNNFYITLQTDETISWTIAWPIRSTTNPVHLSDSELLLERGSWDIVDTVRLLDALITWHLCTNSWYFAIPNKWHSATAIGSLTGHCVNANNH